ncbi:unnamed protein product [Pedinophyceae sp. YPF-701]|nr:unnamed protein product [Pedinophyceae sp. YPF-701]
MRSSRTPPCRYEFVERKTAVGHRTPVWRGRHRAHRVATWDSDAYTLAQQPQRAGSSGVLSHCSILAKPLGQGMLPAAAARIVLRTTPLLLRASTARIHRVAPPIRHRNWPPHVKPGLVHTGMKQSNLSKFFGGAAAARKGSDEPASAQVEKENVGATNRKAKRDGEDPEVAKRQKVVASRDGADARASPIAERPATLAPALEDKDEARGAGPSARSKKQAVVESDSDSEPAMDSSDESEDGIEFTDDDSDVEQVDLTGPKAPALAAGSKKSKAKKGSKSGPAGGPATLAAAYLGVKAGDEVTWTRGKPVPYSVLTNAFEDIGETTKRIEITQILTKVMRVIAAGSPGDLLPAAYLCTNRVAPAYEGVELGLGDATLIKALAACTGRKEDKVKAEYGEVGDLGRMAVQARAKQRVMFKQACLTVPGVFKAFKDIALISGQGSQKRKEAAINKLLAASEGAEAGYIMRSLQGKLRIGLAEQTVLVALAHAATMHHLEAGGKKLSVEELAERLVAAEEQVKRSYSDCPSYDVLVPALLEGGVECLAEKVAFTPGMPIKPMLAKGTNGVQQVLDKFEGRAFTCEYKYDGERAQVHIMEGGKKIKIFSRNAEDVTQRYPDVVARVTKALAEGVQDVVLDCEAVAYDVEQQRILPFQVLSTRGRKEVKVEDIKVQVCLYAFDCLYLNGKSLLRQPLSERREALYKAVVEVENEMKWASYKTSTDVEELGRFLDESIEACTEGLIVKTLDDPYEPSKRSNNWLKLKKDYLDTGGDTYDVVPVGAWFGKGKRTGVYGSYLLAIYDPDSERFQTICKIGTGFSEQQLEDLANTLNEHLIDKPRPFFTYGETLVPDVWFDAKVVWEVKAADLSISPVHKAAIGLEDPEKGISIRFPRLLRVRDDKGPEDSTSPEQIVEMYRQQATLKAGKAPEGGGDDY